jgi:flagellar biosynthesis/type III secretory pathway protein FliH
MVKNLVGTTDGVSVDKLLEVAREALSAAGPTKTAVVRVHPDDLALMQAAALHSGEGAPVELRADTALGKGDIVVDTPAGRVDGTRRARLDRLERSVRHSVDTGELGQGRGGSGDGP